MWSRYYWKKRCKSARDKVEAHKKEQALKILKKGKHQRYFTARGGLNIALRKSVCGVAAHALGLALELDVHTSTVTTWEHKLRATQISAMRWFYKMRYADIIMKARTDGGLWLALHDIRADATNANVFRESKLSY